MKCSPRNFLAPLVSAVLLLTASSTVAVTLTIDYSLDNSKFFGAMNPAGAGTQARAALQAAADFYSTILNDSLSAIVTPAPIQSSISSSKATFSWTMGMNEPSSGSIFTIVDPSVSANEYRIYAGARNLAGETVGEGGPGWVSTWGYTVSGSGVFSPSEVTQINATVASFSAALDRGQSSGFAEWGGSVAFDSNTNWHYDHTSAPAIGETDFYSVAIHELAHTLGFGASSVWDALGPNSGSPFQGAAAMAKYGGPVPLSPDLGHWQAGINSVIYGGATAQVAAMTPSLTVGTRRQLTELDAAALTDLGWQLIAPPGITGDYNSNDVVDAADYVLWRDKLNQSVTLPNDSSPGTVTAADYTAWRTNFGKSVGSGVYLDTSFAVPEPSTLMMVLIGSLAAQSARRKRRG